MDATGHSRHCFWFFVTLLLLGVATILQPSSAQSQTQAIRPIDLLLASNQLALLNAEAAASTRSEQVSTIQAAVAASNPPSWSRMAFQSRRSGNWDIYISAPDGAQQVPLTNDALVDIEPSLARGGQQIAFISNRRKRDLLTLHVMNTSGANLRALTDSEGNDNNPSWSPDGYTIAFESNRSNNTDIYRITADKTGLLRLTYTDGYDGQPSWSPDGSQLVFTSNRTGVYSLWRMNADGSNQTQLTFTSPALYPAWSPDGDKVAFSMDGSGDGFVELWQMDIDGNNLQKLADNYFQGDAWQAAWSPNGEWITYQVTEWVKQGEQWVWRDSRLKMYGFNSVTLEPILDTTLWHPNWTTLDISAPGTCTPSTTARQNAATFLVGLSATDVGPAGVKRYQAARRNTANDAWQLIPQNTVGSSFLYRGQTGQQVEFRCRASDAAGNWAPWTDQPTAQTTIDTTLPQSSVSVGQPRVRGNQVQVQWLGSDPGGTIAGYDIWLRAKPDIMWQPWQDKVTTTSAMLTGDVGKIYEIRSQATDQSGHLEPWQPAAQASVLFYATVLNTNVTDNRGNPAILYNYTIEPAAAETLIITPTTTMQMYLGNSPTHQLTIVGGGARTLPPAHLATMADTTFHWVLPAQDEQIENGEFEAAPTAGWEVIGADVSRVTTAHTGAYALQLQRTTVGTTAIRQQLFLSDTLHAPTLSWLQQLSPETTGFVVKLQTTLASTLVYQQDAAAQSAVAAGWVHHWVDLTPYQGQPITLTYALSNSVGLVWLDELSVGSWATAGPLTVAPTTWQHEAVVNLHITGTHFISTPQVYLGTRHVDAVTVLSPTTLAVTVPAGYRAGNYDLAVINPDRSSSLLHEAVSVKAEEVLLPIIARMSANQVRRVAADWPMLAQNPTRTAYNPNDPGGSHYRLAWQQQIPFATDFILNGLVATEDTLVATVQRRSGQLTVVAFDTKTGESRWESPNHDSSIISAPTIAHGTVYYMVNDYNNATNLYAVDLQTGEERWRYAVVAYQSSPDRAPLVVGNQVFVHGTSSGQIFAVNAGSGAHLWTSALNNYGRRAFAYDNGRIYGGAHDGFYTLDLASGQTTLINSYPGFAIEDPPIISGRYAIIGGRAALDLTTNQLAWQHTVYAFRGAMHVVDNRNILYRAGDNELQAIRVEDGTLLWSIPINSVYYVFAGAGEYIYASTSTTTYIINRNTHQIVQELDQGGMGIVANGHLYLASQTGRIFAYRAEQP